MNPTIRQAAANLRYVRRYCIRLAIVENHYRKTNHPRRIHAKRMLDWWVGEMKLCEEDLNSVVLDAYVPPPINCPADGFAATADWQFVEEELNGAKVGSK